MDNRPEWENEAVAKYWAKYYIYEGKCLLCHNTGFIRTRPISLTSPSETFCICPNGQSARHQTGSD